MASGDCRRTLALVPSADKYQQLAEEVASELRLVHELNV
jgi:hypothetical protein